MDDLSQCAELYSSSGPVQKVLFAILILSFFVGSFTKWNIPDVIKKLINSFLKKGDEKNDKNSGASS